jgi:hypothetical protein
LLGVTHVSRDIDLFHDTEAAGFVGATAKAALPNPKGGKARRSSAQS